MNKSFPLLTVLVSGLLVHQISAQSFTINAPDTTARTISFGTGEVTSTGTLTVGGGTRTIRVQGTSEIINSGLILQNGTGRAIDFTTAAVTLTLTNNTGATIQAVAQDAVRIDAASTLNLTNAGTIYSGPNIAVNPMAGVGTGQALDFVSGIGGTLLNESTGLIRADGADAVRLGSNMTLTNFGTIRGNSVINDSSANNVFNMPPNDSIAEAFSTSEGVSFEDGANSTLINHGTISGSRHGVESSENATNVTITNNATGQIIGRNGSGIGFDSTSTAAGNVVITNSGLIRGDYAGVGNVIDRTGNPSFTNDGDGDGIDVDGSVTINNTATGQILSTGAGGFDTGGRANNSEGVAIGGGVVNNSGLIRGANRGILVNNDANLNRSAVAATTITNSGTIEGQNGYGIRLEGSFNDTITNTGTIIGTGAIPDPLAVVLLQNGTTDPANGTLNGQVFGAGSARFIRGDGSTIQMGEGNDTLDNTGTISSSNGRAVNLEGGDDTMIVRSGSSINGLVDGGAHTTGDTLELHINGLTAQKILDLQAGLVVVIGGISFQNFEIISGATTSQSYELLATSPTSKGVGAVLDNLQAGATPTTTALISTVDNSSNPNQALTQLTPTSFEGLSNIAINNAGQLGDLVGGRMDVIRSGPVAKFDASGIRVWDRALSRSLQRMEFLLADMGEAQQRGISDSSSKSLPLVEMEPENRWGAFLNGNVVFGDQGATNLLPESDYTTAAFTAGMDYRVTDSLALGFFGGYAHTDANLDALGSESEINTAQVGVFGTYQWKQWFVDGVFAYAHSFYENNRIALGTSNTSDPDGDQVAFQTRLGYDFEVQTGL
ncbi:MAG: autotransporter domain-containing protein [Blastochloris sp.]|nr:autotransporter domain-containing protein [Blastochloris sp.]